MVARKVKLKNNQNKKPNGWLCDFVGLVPWLCFRVITITVFGCQHLFDIFKKHDAWFLFSYKENLDITKL